MHWLNRPSEQLDKYPIILEYLQSVTAAGDADVNFLEEAIEAMRDIQGAAQLKAFQKAMGKGLMGKLEWYNLVPEDMRRGIPKQVARRQV